MLLLPKDIGGKVKDNKGRTIFLQLNPKQLARFFHCVEIFSRWSRVSPSCFKNITEMLKPSTMVIQEEEEEVEETHLSMA